VGLYIGCGGERGNGVTCTGTTWNMGQELKDCSNLGLYFGFCLRPFIGQGYVQIQIQHYNRPIRINSISRLLKGEGS
jgi:hypothetical protein